MLQEEQPDQGLFFGSVNKIIYSIILKNLTLSLLAVY